MKHNSKELLFDATIYAPSILEKAAYKGMNYFTITLVQQENMIQCLLTANQDVEIEAFHRSIEEFKKDVIDYNLRDRLQRETAEYRNLIIGLAFSQTEFVSHE